MKRLTVLILILLSTPALAGGFSFESRVAYIEDGDTFRLMAPRVNIRLCGVDTPRKNSVAGQAATRALRSLIEGKTVSCLAVGDGTPCDGRSPKKSYNRFVAQCFVDGRDLAELLAVKGVACDWPKYSGGYYGKWAKCAR